MICARNGKILNPHGRPAIQAENLGDAELVAHLFQSRRFHLSVPTLFFVLPMFVADKTYVKFCLCIEVIWFSDELRPATSLPDRRTLDVTSPTL